MSFGSGDLGMGVSFSLIDNFSNPANGIANSMLTLEDIVTKIGMKSFLLNQMSEALENVKGAINAITGPGEVFDQNLHELSAIAGIAGDHLDIIGDKALGLSVKFGSSASDGVNSFKNVLSKLGPEVAANETALAGMGDSIFTLSKTMENDLAGATTALTTTMNIYASSITDPMEMNAEMAKQMNAMAAAAQVGSAEVTDIAASIKTGGLAAKNAGVSFEELNTLIQIMGKGTVYASEAGIALRNTLAIMSQGRYMPKDAREGLIAAGVDIAKIGDATVPVKERLMELQKIQSDASLITKVFGMENKNAFMVLMENIGLFDEWNQAITGTTSGYDQAAVVMDSYSEKMARVNARLEAFKISVFNATKEALPFVQTGLMMLTGVVNIAPAFMAASEGMRLFRTTSLYTTFATQGLTMGLRSMAVAAWTAMAPLLPYIAAAAAIAGAFYAAYKGVQLFRDLMDGKPKESGMMGWLQQLGGVITGIIQIWQTWNGETFMLTGEMRDALEKAGILEFVLDLGTWVVRIKEMFGSMVEVMGEVWGVVKEMFGGINAAFDEVTEVLDSLGLGLGKTSSALEIFRFIGKMLAGLITVTLVPLIAVLTVGWVALRTAAVLAVAGFRLIVAAGASVANFFIGLTNDIMMIVEWIGKLWDSMDGLGDSFVEWFDNLPDAMYNVGSAIVGAISEGISSAWDMLVYKLITLIADLPFAGEIMDFFGIGGPSGKLSVTGAGAGSHVPQSIGRTIADTKAMQANNKPAVIDKTVTNTESVQVNMVMDGDVIAKNLITREQLDHDRR